MLQSVERPAWLDGRPQVRCRKGQSRQAKSVRATLVLSDLASLNLPLSLDLQWSGGLLATEPKTRTITTVPGLKTIVTTSSGIRNSELVTGALVLNGLDLLSPANVTAGSGISGFVTVSKGSTIEITRTH